MFCLQLADLCHVDQKPADKTDGEATEKTASEGGDDIKKDTLINLEENGEIDGFTIDDLKDDFFNPRAGSSDDDDEFNPRAGTAPSPAAAPAAAPKEPVLSPPPALPPRDSAKVQNNNIHSDNIFGEPAAESTNPFASSKPFAPVSATIDPFGMSSFDSANQQPFGGSSAFSKFPANNTISSGFTDGWSTTPAALAPAINAMSFEDLDPLKKWTFFVANREFDLREGCVSYDSLSGSWLFFQYEVLLFIILR